jgi:hypothetical protein
MTKSFLILKKYFLTHKTWSLLILLMYLPTFVCTYLLQPTNVLTYLL